MSCACSIEHKNLICRYCHKLCCSSFCPELEKEKLTFSSDGKVLHCYSEFIQQHLRGGSTLERLRASSAEHTRILLPTSCSSTCGARELDMNTEIRENGHGASDFSEERPQDSTFHPQKVACGSLTNFDGKSFHDATSLDISSSVVLERHENSNNGDKGALMISGVEDVRSIIDGDESDGVESLETAIENSNAAFLSTIETDPLFWLPPEPVDIEDDMDSVAYMDDDDEYDGTKWAQSSSLSGFEIEGGNSFKEERQRAMMEAMNGQFKILVSRFLASEDINFSEGGHGEKWLDIVVSLSWEAALSIKPEANEGRAMDPGSYVKVKCVATGARSQSEVIKGLVFKKNTAHKHMPTKFKNPRLLLLQGVLGNREVGLSSFNSMIFQENDYNDYLKPIHEMIETCHPNVVMVEKSVSRDMQEFLLAKGMTLVFDMKLTRLNRISRCLGSPIMSCEDILACPKVKHCDSFHIEKFVEEHNSSSEGGKKSSKTLLFLEGFPKPLGCTILLKGAPIAELKKIKRVLQYTVFAAYHLILETSFFADQRALFPHMHAEENESFERKTDAADYFIDSQGTEDSVAQANALNIASSNGYLDVSSHETLFSDSNFKSNGSLQSPRHTPDTDCNENNQACLLDDKLSEKIVGQPDLMELPEIPWQFMTSFSSSLKRFLSDSFAPPDSESMSSYFGFKEEDSLSTTGAFPVSPSPEANEHETEENSGGSIQDKRDDESSKTENTEAELRLNEAHSEHNPADVNHKTETQNKDSIDTVRDPQSILVLTSSQCIEKGLLCEQSHLSRINYYGNCDKTLGRFLRDSLLNKNYRCSSCGEPPDAHIYSYTHQNGNLTVQVKELSPQSALSGAAEGKIWMWTRCLKCEQESGISRSTPRVVMSTAARGLSFGKFLELSFSSHSMASRLSSKCGHSLHRDCLRYFGLGSKVAMFRYSPVEIYTACKPPPVLDSHAPHGQEWIKKEAKSLLQKGDTLFLEVTNFLQKLKNGDFGLFQKQSKNSLSSLKDLSEVEEMLIQEKAEFEASLLKAISFSRKLGKDVNEILSLSWLNQELLFGLYIWDRRLHSLLQCTKENAQYIQDAVVPSDMLVEGSTKDCNISSQNTPQIDESSSPNYSFQVQSLDGSESELKIDSGEISNNDSNTLVSDVHHENGSPLMVLVGDQSTLTEEERQYQMQTATSAPAVLKQLKPNEAGVDSDVTANHTSSNGDCSTASMSHELHRSSSAPAGSCSSKSKDPNEWIWAPAVELRRIYRMDLQGGSLQKFEYIRSYTPKYLSPIHIDDHEETLHFPLGADGSVISACEDDLSSIIACALALSEDQQIMTENTDDKDATEGRGESDHSFSATYDNSTVSSMWSSTGSVESEGMHPSRSVSSLSLDELSTSGSESSYYLDRLLASEKLHPEIFIGGGRAVARNKYSVVLVYAKQFYNLRRMCCLSELAYIASLSRSRKWDAQGGKSKAFFAKTQDDRFIIKQVKKTELDSFLKFSSEYFGHISYSINSGSQTCLAKILGIYQVRQNRGGKEVKTDLVVMENLLFGRNFSRIYDLKGSVLSRYIPDPNEHKVLLDQNFVEDMRTSPMYIAGRNKHLFQRAIWNDTSFLTSINVMDYSLLVGVDRQRRELVFGIIDYLRQYTWDKQLETWVKSSLVVPKNSLPTIVSPKDYKRRFRNFMSKYFLTVPDTWSSEQDSSGPCRFCHGGGTRNSAAAESQK